MKYIILTITLVVPLLGFSQEHKTKKKSGDIYTEYFSIRKDNKQKDGRYVKIEKQSKDTLVIGQYINGAKTGVWEFRSPNNRRHLQYDFDKKNLVFTPLSINKIDSFLIRRDSTFEVGKVDSPPIFLGYKNEIIKELQWNPRLPAEIFEKKLYGISLASIEVTKEGLVKNPKIESSLTKNLDIELLKALGKIRNEWVPAKVNGVPIDTKILVAFNITTNPEAKLPSKPYLYTVNIVYYGITRTETRVGPTTQTTSRRIN